MPCTSIFCILLLPEFNESMCLDIAIMKDKESPRKRKVIGQEKKKFVRNNTI